MHRLSTSLVAAAVFLGLAASLHAAPPETLKLSDLPGHPERWPESVTINDDFQLTGGVQAKKGMTVPVIEMQGNDLVVDLGKNSLAAIDAGQCDLLEQANKMWATLTPEQRAVDAASVEKDPSLWPDKVKVKTEFGLNTGQTIPAGTEYGANIVEKGEVVITLADPTAIMRAPIGQTDLLQRARELAKIEPAKRPSRIAEILKKHRVDADGKLMDSADLENTKIFALYFGASWCGPCRQFSPDLVKVVNASAAANPKLTVVMLNYDDEAPKMFGYMKEAKMPFGSVPKGVVQDNGPLAGYGCNMIPQLVITDRYGKVLANTYMNGQYNSPQQTLKQLQKILGTGVAK